MEAKEPTATYHTRSNANPKSRAPKSPYDNAYWEKVFAKYLDEVGDEMPCRFTPEELAKELEASDNDEIVDEEEINSFFAWMLSR